MKDFIKEFYYGNIDPQARSIKQSKAVMKEMQTLNETEEYLTAKLKGEEKSKFLDHVNAWSVVNGDYYLPCFTLPEVETKEIGVWGMRHLDYLKSHRKATYNRLSF